MSEQASERASEQASECVVRTEHWYWVSTNTGCDEQASEAPLTSPLRHPDPVGAAAREHEHRAGPHGPNSTYLSPFLGLN